MRLIALNAVFFSRKNVTQQNAILSVPFRTNCVKALPRKPLSVTVDFRRFQRREFLLLCVGTK